MANAQKKTVFISDAYYQAYQFDHAYDRGGPTPMNGKYSATIDEAAQQISRPPNFNGGLPRWGDQNYDGVTDITYSFLTGRTPSYYNERLVGFSEFSPQQKAQAVLAMQSWADVANVRFHHANGGGDGHIFFGNYDSDPCHKDRGAMGSFPNTSGHSDALFRFNEKVSPPPANGNYGRQALTHEIGHTLGLQHPSNYDAANNNSTPLTYINNAAYAQDSRGYSVMSYFSESETKQNFTKGGGPTFASGPLIDDIAAIQKLYGANYNTRSGDTTYGFNSNTGVDYYSAKSSSDKLVFSVWDGGGNDTLDFSGFTQDQKINLNAGSFSDVGGMRGNVSIAKGVTIENAIGGSGNNILIGNEVANVLKGGAGNDIIHGGGGADILWGGKGANTFLYTAISDSTPQARDWIMDFYLGQNKIDLTGITHGAGLNFVNAFTGHSREAVLSYDSHTNQGSLAVDFAGHGSADFAINLIGKPEPSDIVA